MGDFDKRAVKIADALYEAEDAYDVLSQTVEIGDAIYPSDDAWMVTTKRDDRPLVVARPEVVGEGLSDVVAMFAHEATHCALHHLIDIVGEQQPGEEELAYHVGAFTRVLMRKFLDWLGVDDDRR